MLSFEEFKQTEAYLAVTQPVIHHDTSEAKMVDYDQLISFLDKENVYLHPKGDAWELRIYEEHDDRIDTYAITVDNGPVNGDWCINDALNYYYQYGVLPPIQALDEELSHLLPLPIFGFEYYQDNFASVVQLENGKRALMVQTDNGIEIVEGCEYEN